MLHSSFDLETHARYHQESTLRWASENRLTEEAWRGRNGPRNGIGSSFAQMIASIRTRLARVRPPAVAPIEAPASAEPRLSVVVSREPRRDVRGHPARAAEPYAAMVVIARAANVPVGESSCSVNDA